MYGSDPWAGREIACKRTILVVRRQAAEADDVRHQRRSDRGYEVSCQMAGKTIIGFSRELPKPAQAGGA